MCFQQGLKIGGYLPKKSRDCEENLSSIQIQKSCSILEKPASEECRGPFNFQ